MRKAPPSVSTIAGSLHGHARREAHVVTALVRGSDVGAHRSPGVQGLVAGPLLGPGSLGIRGSVLRSEHGMEVLALAAAAGAARGQEPAVQQQKVQLH